MSSFGGPLAEPNYTFDAKLVGPWVCQHAGGTWFPGRGTAIGQFKDGRLVAGVLYEDFNHAHVICHIAGFGRWATRKFLRIIFDYPFNQLMVKRITVPVAASNIPSRRFVEHLGFTLEATLIDAHPDGDLLIYRMMAHECRWLEPK